jgi:hypothetical protein
MDRMTAAGAVTLRKHLVNMIVANRETSFDRPRTVTNE